MTTYIMVYSLIKYSWILLLIQVFSCLVWTWWWLDVEDIISLLAEVQEAVMDYSRFISMVDLEAFSSFKSALYDINSNTEGIIHHVTVI